MYEYGLVSGTDKEKVVNGLNEAIRDGWEYVSHATTPYGEYNSIHHTFLIRRKKVTN